MPLNKFKRGKTYYLRGTVRGQRIYETTGTSEKAAAEAIRVSREKELLDESIYGKKATATFEQAALSYIETGKFDRWLGQYDELTGKWSGILGHFWGWKLHAIKQADLDRAAVKLMPDAKGQSRNRNIYTPFIAVWNHAEKQQLCEARRWLRPKSEKEKKRRFATLNEIDALEAAAPKHLKPLIIFLAYTGARMTEALEMHWSDVDLAQRWCVFQKTKRKGESRGVPLHPRALAALESITIPQKLKRRGMVFERRGAVFRTNKYKPYVDKGRQSGGQIKSAWRTTCKKAGIENLTPHCLRHTFATWLGAVGTRDQEKDLLMGHASDEMSRLYAKVPQARLIEAVNRLPMCAKDVQHLSEGWRNSLTTNIG